MPASMERTRLSGNDTVQFWRKPANSRLINVLAALLLLFYTTTSNAAATPADARAVARLYSAAFDREPDSGGLNFWIDSLEKGQSLLQISEKFRNSPEFNARYGALGNPEFVAQLYRNILGREGEAEGMAFWLDSLASGVSQAFVLRQFSESAENRSKTDELFGEMHQRGDGLWTYDPVSGPVNSSGTIDGFGSIFVNGVEFETEGANITLDGNSSTEDNLHLGMVVRVNGVVNDDGLTGTATRVQFDDEVQGPITALVPGQDGDTLLLTVLGVEVIVERTSTVFNDVSFETLAVNDLVEVSGFFSGQGRLRATFIERKSVFTAGSSEVELKGLVTALADTQFTIGEYLVDFSGADLTGVSGGVIVSGMQVEVHGTLGGSSITANRIEQEDNVSLGFDDRDEVRVEGAITNFASTSRFELNGVAVDGSVAILRPASLVLANGEVVQVEGQWIGNTLVARKIESRRGRIEIEARVASVDSTAGTITMRLFSGALTVTIDARTLLDDDTDRASPLTLADLSPGDFLEVEAQQVGGKLVAARIDRDDQDDDVLQAQVSDFTSGVDITLLGITYITAGASFEGVDGTSMGSEAFFARLKVGDLVKVKDERVADGIADEVEFEHPRALDGDDFRDGCEPGDDCGGDDSGQDCEPGDDCGGGDSGQDCEPGDDCGGNDSGQECEPGDDCGGDDSGQDCEPGDDCGGDDSGQDCEPGDDCGDGNSGKG